MTYVVVNGTWEDGTKTNKSEAVEDGQSPAQIPTGMLPAENYEGGAWSPNPIGAVITGNTTFTYAFTAKQPPTPMTYEAKDNSGNAVYAFTWQKGSGKTLGLTIKRSEADELTFDKFTSLEVDGKTVEARYYTPADGSLKLTVKAEYLETLSVGDHEIKVNFDDGSAAVKLTVKARANDPIIPRTGDENKLELWMGLVFLSIVANIALLVYVRKRRTE